MGVTLCDQQDIVDRLGRSLTAPEIIAWPGKAKEASVLVEGYLNRSWADFFDVPDNVRVVVSRMVRRVLMAGVSGGAPGGMLPNASSFNSGMGPLSHSTAFGADVEYGDVWLSKADKMMLNKPADVVTNAPMFHRADHSRDGYDFCGAP